MFTSPHALTANARDLTPEIVNAPKAGPQALELGQAARPQYADPGAVGQEQRRSTRSNPPRAGPGQFGGLRRFLRFPELSERCGVDFSRMHILRLEKAGKFPKRVQLGDNSVAWIEVEIIAWQAERIAARDRATELLGKPDQNRA